MKKQLTIYYTDDDQEDRDFFIETIDMTDANIRAITHTTAQELLKALENPPLKPGIVFLDINMPGMTGLETVKKLRETDKLKSHPVVTISTSNDPVSVKNSRDLGANFYVPKPGALDKLKKSIAYTLSINWETFNPTEKEFVYGE